MRGRQQVAWIDFGQLFRNQVQSLLQGLQLLQDQLLVGERMY